MSRRTHGAVGDGADDRYRSPAAAAARDKGFEPYWIVHNPFEPFDGERKFVSVLFADIVKSSSMVSGCDPEHANDLLLPILQLLMDSAHQFGGTVTQVLGDGIMVVFGAPIAQEDHAIRACLAADGMQTAIRLAFGARPPQAGPPIEIRAGINSGEVVIQTVENDLSAEYRVAGETVYIAARMEKAARPGVTLLSEDTLKLAARWIEASRVGRFSLTVGSRRVTAFELERVTRNKTNLRRALPPRIDVFVGRDDDIEFMHDVLRSVENGDGKALIVTGEAGVGKSRLVHEFLRSGRADQHHVIECALLPTGLAQPLEPLARIVGSLMAVEPDATADTISAEASRLLDSLDIANDIAVPAVLGIFDVPHDSPSWLALDPPERLGAMINTATRIILAASRHRPVIIVFDDFHWAGSETRLLAEELACRLASSRVLLAVTSRTGHGGGDIDWPGAIVHRLSRLTARQSAEFFQSLLGDAAELDDLKELLVKTTQGIPFFIEECVRTLVETGALSGAEGAYHPQVPIESLQMPPSVHAVLAARIDSLARVDRSVLLCASVVGQNFDVGLLREITELSAEELIVQLNRLQAAGFVQNTRILPNLEYGFGHALIHDVAYRTLLKRRRRELHGRLVGAIRKRRAEQLSGKIELLAYHAYRAEAWPQAAVYGHMAGQKAQSKSRNREAADFFDKALQALERLPQTRRNMERSIDTRLDLIQSLFPLGKLTLGHAELLKARESAQELRDERRLAIIASNLSVILWRDGHLSQAVKVGRTAMRLAKRLANFELEILSTVRLGALLVDDGDYERACQLLEATIAKIPDDSIDKRFGMLATASVACRATLARSLGELGRFDEALRFGDEAISIADEVGHAFSRIYAQLHLGDVFLTKGDFKMSIPLLEQGLELCESTRSNLLVPRVTSSLGYAYVRTDRVSQGLSLLEEAANRADRQPELSTFCQQCTRMAEAYLIAGLTDAAMNRGVDALELAQQHGGKSHEAWALWILGEIYTSLNELSDARIERYFHRAQAIAEECGIRPLVAHCNFGRGKLYRRMKAWDKARDEFDAATSRYRELGMDYWLELVQGKAETRVKAPLIPVR